MADKSYEKHVEDLIKVRSEIRKAAESYSKQAYDEEAWHMCRAIAMAEALEINMDEFFLHKRIVEKEFGTKDVLIMDDFFTHYKGKGDVYVLLFIDTYDTNYHEEVIFNEKEAQNKYEELVRKYFDMDNRKEDSWGNTFYECTKNYKEAFFGDNENHGEIYISLRSHAQR